MEHCAQLTCILFIVETCLFLKIGRAPDFLLGNINLIFMVNGSTVIFYWVLPSGTPILILLTLIKITDSAAGNVYSK